MSDGYLLNPALASVGQLRQLIPTKVNQLTVSFPIYPNFRNQRSLLPSPPQKKRDRFSIQFLSEAIAFFRVLDDYRCSIEM
ncbi:hypothetical protein [Coleofasciculus sp. FACHB-SPT9]|uniref:hypothetical protein n=1 Tax=Coleofasciculus sp. FACHB-SPT9 TaxID=2692791 RepID=UPI0016837F97|nr:hypothetical protein [Coleofasciculus sp. FACHB-SPT9]